jgi:DnaJ family protein C protein 7
MTAVSSPPLKRPLNAEDGADVRAEVVSQEEAEAEDSRLRDPMCLDPAQPEELAATLAEPLEAPVLAETPPSVVATEAPPTFAEELPSAPAADTPAFAKASAADATPDPAAAAPNAESLKGEGNAAFKAQQYVKAIEKYTEAITLDPSSHVLHSNRAMCHAARCDWDSAKVDAQCAMTLSNGDFPKAHFHLGRAQFRLGDAKVAEATLQEALQRFEPNTSYRKEVRDLQTLLEEVRTELRRLEEAAKPKAELYKEQGNVKYKAGQYRSSLADYTRAIEAAEAEGAKPEKRAAYFGNRAAAYLMLKEPRKCTEDCKAALALDVTGGKLWQRLCAAYLASADFGAALASADDGAKVEGLTQGESLSKFRDQVSSLQASWKEGAEAMNGAEYQKAMRQFQAVESGGVTASEELALLMGRCRMMQGEHVPVINLTKDVLRQNPQNVEAYVLRAEALYMSNEELIESKKFDDKLQEGMRLLKQALGFDPDHPGAQRARKKMKLVSDSVVTLREKMGCREFEEAKEIMNKVMEIDPQNKRLLGRLYEQRAKANLRLKDYQLAIKDAAQATYHDHELRDAYITRASAYEKLLKYEEAVKVLESLFNWCREEMVYKRLQDAKFALRKSKRTDFYALLGVPSVASNMEIKKAFREKAAEWHPDKKGHLDESGRKNAEDMFKRINEAHEILTDPVRKAWYDEGYDEEGIKEKLEEKKMRESQRRGGHPFAGG